MENERAAISHAPRHPTRDQIKPKTNKNKSSDKPDKCKTMTTRCLVKIYTMDKGVGWALCTHPKNPSYKIKVPSNDTL